MSDHDSGSESESNKQPALNEDEVTILQSYIEQWESAEVSDRNKILKAAATEAQTKAPIARQSTETWFRNQGMKRKLAKPPIKMGQRWTERSVIDTLRKKELLKTIQDETGAKPGTKEMINHYTKQLNLLIASLSPDELKEARETADIWNHQGVLDDSQVRHCQEKKTGQGMRVFVVSAWKNEEGKIHVAASHISSSHDYNNEYGGAGSFMKTRKWDAILPEWDAYAESAFGRRRLRKSDGNLDGDAVATRKKGRQDKTYILDVGDNGYPVLPACDSMDLDTKKAVVHAFLTWHYRKCCGDPKISIPWKYFIPRCGEIIPTECLPEGHNLAEPSKLRQIHATELLQFWYNRQEEGKERVLEFIGWWDNDKEDMVLAADMEVPATIPRKNKTTLKEKSDPPRKQARQRQQSSAGRSQSGINAMTKRAMRGSEMTIQHGTAASGRAHKNHKGKRPSNKESDDARTISDKSLAEQSNGSEDDLPSSLPASVPNRRSGRPISIPGSNDSDSEVEENIREKSVKPVGARGKKVAFPIQAAAADIRSTKKGAAVEKPKDGPRKHVQKGLDPEHSASTVTRKAIAPRQRMADFPTEAGRSSHDRNETVVGAKAKGQKRTAKECLEGPPAKRKRSQGGVQQDKVAAIEPKEKPRKKQVEEATDGSPSKRTRSKTSQPAAGKCSRKLNSWYNDYVKS
ncbi:hypothetical protein EV424DRAFT_1346333 [Suillus variegatus]|nr:hypothetical protein EV424DRAFT_1346333 [Suillus variegatus]